MANYIKKPNSNKIIRATFDSVAELQAAPSANFDSDCEIQLAGYYADDPWSEVLDLELETTTGGVNSFLLDDGRYANLYADGPINVKWFGAKGDGVTDDTSNLSGIIDTAVASNLLLYFPTGTYLCNISKLSYTWSAAAPRLLWKGDGKRNTTLKAYDNTKDCVKIIPTNYLIACEFEGLNFSGNGGSSNHAFYGDVLHYSKFKDCSFNDALIGYRSRSFGCNYDFCSFSGSYGYVGVGNTDSYAGWHTFRDCVFRGSKIAYAIDNDTTPASNSGGGGNLHLRSDFEAITGLAIFLRNQGNNRQWETFQSTWWEGNANSGTVDTTSFPFLSNALSTIGIPASGIYIRKNATASGKHTYTKFLGDCPGFDIDVDCIVEADRLSNTNVNTNGAVRFDINIGLFSPRGAGSGPVGLPIYANQIKIEIPGESQKGVYAKTPAKSTWSYDFINTKVDPLITDLSGLTLNGTASASVVNDGVLLKNCYEITLQDGDSFLFRGTETNSSFFGGYGVCYYSFSIKGVGDDFNVAPYTFQGVTAGDAGNPIEARNGQWDTYQLVAAGTNPKWGFINNTGSAVTFRITDFQAVPVIVGKQQDEEVSTFINTNGFAGLTISGSYIVPKLTTKAQGILQSAALYSMYANNIDFIDLETGSTYYERIVAEGINNGGFESWSTTTNLDDWIEGVNISVLQESTDVKSGLYSCDFSGNGGSSSAGNWLYLSGVLTEGTEYQILIKAKRLSGAGALNVATGYGDDTSLITDAEATGDWQLGKARITSGSLKHLILLTTSGTTWRIDNIMAIDLTNYPI